jgi:hypothetical protein
VASSSLARKLFTALTRHLCSTAFAEGLSNSLSRLPEKPRLELIDFEDHWRRAGQAPRFALEIWEPVKKFLGDPKTTR